MPELTPRLFMCPSKLTYHDHWPWNWHTTFHTICPRSSYPFYILTYLVSNSWTLKNQMKYSTTYLYLVFIKRLQKNDTTFLVLKFGIIFILECVTKLYHHDCYFASTDEGLFYYSPLLAQNELDPFQFFFFCSFVMTN